MWTRWNKRSSRGCSNAAADSVVTTTVTVTAKTPSLKDLQSLLLLQEQDEAAAPKKSSSSTIFHRVRIASTAIRAWKSSSSAAANANADSNRSIVLYYTSLRVVRRTFEDCRAVRSILRGFRVAIDERDLSMDSSFLSELQGKKEQLLSLPRLFVGGRYVGGADEVQMLHETGELKKIIEGGAPPLVGPGGTCQGCGGFRFVLCGSCSGSHKYFHKDKGAFLTCTACNENGLLRCPEC